MLEKSQEMALRHLLLLLYRERAERVLHPRSPFDIRQPCWMDTAGTSSDLLRQPYTSQPMTEV